MDVFIKLTLPGYVYRFYHDASLHIAGSSPERLMSDALCAYAGMLNEGVAKLQKSLLESAEASDGYSEPSKSR